MVGHGLGGCIAYDALTTLWAEMHELHTSSGPLGVQPNTVGDFQAMQFALWQDLRQQGNLWRTTDFVTLGTPMALADMFVARPPILAGLSRSDSRPELFNRLIRRGVVVSCPPEEMRAGPPGTSNALDGQSVFAVTRWTNIWFPVRRGSIRGDLFGGVLRPLFGPGIREIAVTGNLPERLRPGAAHTTYFARPDHDTDGDVAFHLRAILALADGAALQASAAAPPPDPSTVSRTVYRSWQRSM